MCSKVIFSAFCVLLSINYIHAGTISNDTLQSLYKIGRECQNETNTTAQDFRHTVIEDKIPNTREQACLFLCVGTRLGFLHRNGTANIEPALKIIESENRDESNVRDILDKSKKIMKICNENNSDPKLGKKVLRSRR